MIGVAFAGTKEQWEDEGMAVMNAVNNKSEEMILAFKKRPIFRHYQNNIMIYYSVNRISGKLEAGFTQSLLICCLSLSNDSLINFPTPAIKWWPCSVSIFLPRKPVSSIYTVD